EVGAGEADYVLRLAAGEADCGQLLGRGRREPLPCRKRVGVCAPLAEALDHPAANSECRGERDLLCRDRGDEGLEGVGSDRRAEAVQARDRLGQIVADLRELVEATEIELEAEQLAHLPDDVVVVRLHLDAAGRCFDPHVAAADDPVEAALVPEVREVGAETAEALRREGEVVRLGNREQRHSSARSTSNRSSNGSYGRPSASRYSASPARAKTWSAETAGQRSE